MLSCRPRDWKKRKCWAKAYSDGSQLHGKRGQLPQGGAGDKPVGESCRDRRDGQDQSDQNQGPDMNRLVVLTDLAPTNFFAHLHHSLLLKSNRLPEFIILRRNHPRNLPVAYFPGNDITFDTG